MTYIPKIDTCGHMRLFLTPDLFQERVELAVKALQSWKYDFDAIAFSGMSGAVISPVVSLRMNKTLIMVRKPDDGSHSGMRVEGDYAARSYIILDDFVSSGQTALRVKDSIREAFRRPVRCLGVLEVNRIEEYEIQDYARRGQKFRLDVPFEDESQDDPPEATANPCALVTNGYYRENSLAELLLKNILTNNYLQEGATTSASNAEATTETAAAQTA